MMIRRWSNVSGWLWCAVSAMLVCRGLAAEVAFTVNPLDQVQTFEAHNGFHLATLAQTPGMNLRLNKLTGRIKLHEHPQSDHFLYLIKGEIELTVGHETRIIGPGHLVTIPKGTPHAMTRRGTSEALFLDIASPPDVGDVVWLE